MITGASGFLGLEVLTCFQAEMDTLGVYHGSPKPGLEKVDLRDSGALREALDRYEPDVVIHLAAYRVPDFCEDYPEEARRLNVEPVRTLADHLPEDVPLLFASTDYVFDGLHPPYAESDEWGPVNVYGTTKVEAESYVLARSSGVVVRMPLLVGAGETLASSGFMAELWNAVRNKEEQRQDNVLVRFPTWTRDVAKVMAWLIRNEHRGLFHYSGLRGSTRYQMMLEFGEIVGESTSHLTPSTEVIQRRAARPPNSQLKPARLQQMGYRDFTDLADVMLDVVSRFSLRGERGC